MAWTEKQQAELVRLAGEGLTGSEIGARLGFSRAAVLGRAHRTGVKLPCKYTLTESDVADIKARLAAGEVQRVLAAEYGVDRSNIGHIKAGFRWSHVPAKPSQEAA